MDMAMINRTRPNYAKVKVIVDLMANLPNHVRMDVEDESTVEMRTKKVKIQYDYLPKYCWECKLQGHSIKDVDIHTQREEEIRLHAIVSHQVAKTNETEE
ncbi:hypothetical protein HAX54_033990 [Datura stramonium]|uniref:Uncharacterized protein n=1 Tax=Datura stramonium TaxID=4076 RepID=A0ABS8VD80_DATST|nr:hypothetical protein [Datura stramonium]